MTATRRIVHGKRSLMLCERINRVETDDGTPLALVHKQRAEIGAYNTDSRKLVGANLLCIHGLGQNRLTYDLPTISPANYFAETGLDVWLADLRGHGLSRELGAAAPSSFDEYVSQDLPALINYIEQHNDGPLFIVGHSLGGTILYSLDPQVCDNVAGFISIAGPYHFGRGLRLLRLASYLLHHTYAVNPLRLVSSDDSTFPIDLVGKLMSGAGFYFNNAHL
ncbi:MAG: alpha/beta fold hydrolase, partial [Candidatus Alcyoniella australis]|nr:alpha/beta fold hydrolase [Candidatus Alcyoniella australis]